MQHLHSGVPSEMELLENTEKGRDTVNKRPKGRTEPE